MVYLATFSKTLFPGLRLGFLVAPPALVDVLAAARAGLTAPAPALEQAALARFIADGHFARHLGRMRRAYRERGDALAGALGQHLGGALDLWPCDTGMQLSATLRGRVGDVRVCRAAAALGVEAAPLSESYLGRPARQGLVLGFGCVRPQAIRAGALTLARAVEQAGAG